MKLYKKWHLDNNRILETNFETEKRELELFDNAFGTGAMMLSHFKRGGIINTKHAFFAKNLKDIPNYKDCKIEKASYI